MEGKVPEEKKLKRGKRERERTGKNTVKRF